MRAHLVTCGVAILMASVCASAEAFAARRYAVLIGNNQGRDDELALRHAEDDASRLAAVLRRLGGFNAQNTVLSLGDSAGSIRQALLEVNARIRAEQDLGGPDSVLVVYYSGHADAEGLHPGRDLIPYDELRALVVGSSARLRVLILDACRSGGLTRVKGGKPAPEFRLIEDHAPPIEGLVMISSSAQGEDSHESERLGGSFFTHHFINALVGAGDANADGSVTLNEAYTYTYNNTVRASGRTISLQHPTYSYEIKGRAELTVTKLDEDRLRSGYLQLAEAGTHLILQGGEDGQLVAEINSEAPGMRLALTAGKYFVQRRSSDHYREYEVEIAPGSEVSLEKVEYRVVAYSRLVRKGAESAGATHGAYLLAGARGEILEGLGPSPHLILGYGLDLEWASLALRMRAGRSKSFPSTSGVGFFQNELAVGLCAQKFIDFPIFSAGIGLMLEGVRHEQHFQTSGWAPSRIGYGLAFGALLTLERELLGPIVLRVEGGPITEVLPQANTDSGAINGRDMKTPLTWNVAAGVGWRL